MQEEKNYILHNIRLLLSLDEIPYDLSNNSSIDKFLSTPDQDSLIISCLPTKEFKVLHQKSTFPEEGQIIHVSKIRSDSALGSFFNISIKPAQQFKYLSSYLQNVYEPILTRKNDPSLFEIKELKAVLAHSLKRKLINEADLNFTTLEEEFDFWQDQDIENPTTRSSYFVEEYAAISKPWKNLETLDFGRMGNLIETTWSVLNKIWNSKHDYNQRRFLKVIELFETEVRSKIKMSFSRESDLLAMTFDIKQKLIESINYCKKFITLSEYYERTSKKKMPNIKLKIIEEFHMKVLATFRTKSKVQLLNKLYEDKMITEDPQSLIFLVKAENFMTNYMSLFKNNPKVEQKLEKEKTKLQEFCRNILPIIEENFKNALKKDNFAYLEKALQKWFFFLAQGEIFDNTTDLQSEVIEKGTAYLQTLTKIALKEVSQKSLSSDKLKIIKNVQKKINDLNLLINEFCQNSMKYPNYNEKVTSLLKSLQDGEKKHLNEFKGFYENLFKDKAAYPKLLGKHIEILALGEEGLEFETSSENTFFIRETKKIIEMNYGADLSEKLLSSFEEAKFYHKENSFIKNMRSRYNNIEGKLQFFQKNNLAKQLNEIKEIISQPPIRKKLSETSYEWKDEQEVEKFIEVFSSNFDRLVQYLKLFNESESEIEQIAIDILSIEFSPQNFFVISQKLQQVNKIMDSVSTNRQTSEWREYWKIKITQIVGLIWKQALLKGLSISLTVNTVWLGGECAYSPDLNEIKEKYLKEVRSYIGWPTQSKHLNGKSILDGETELVVRIYEQIEENFERIKNRLGIFAQIEKTLNIDIDMLEEKLNRDQLSSQNLAEVLQKIKSVKGEIDLIQDDEKIGAINIENQDLKESLLEITDEKIQSIIQLIRYSIKMESEQVEEYINNAMSKLDAKPNNMNEMGQAMREYDKIRESQEQIEEKIKKIQTRNANIRAITGGSFNTVNMMKRWENFQIASVEMGRILGEQRNRLQDDAIKKSQNLSHEVRKLQQRYHQIKPKSQNLDREEVLEIYGRIKEWYGHWSEIEEKANSIVSDIKAFNMKMPDFSVYNETKGNLNEELQNWILFMDFRAEVEKLQPEEWITFRGSVHKYGDLINKYNEKLKQSKHHDSAYKFFLKTLEDCRESLNLYKCVTGQNFEKEHWGMLFSILKIKNVTSIDKLCFFHLLEADFLENAHEIRELQARARGQIAIRDALNQLDSWQITREFELTDYNSMGRVTSLIKEWKDVMTEVSDNQALVSSIRQSKYAGRFKAEIGKYETKFGILDDALLKLNQIQRKWIYLEPIFMRGALPSEQGRWRRLDEQYRNIMNNVANDPRVMALSGIAGFQETLNNIIIQLERCQKALNDFLEEKRNKFPRFYFLGDDDMLEILGQSQNPTIIQLHLKKLFSGIHTVKFGENNEKLLAMRSSLGEQVRMSSEIEVTEVVEDWLQQLNKNMVVTLKKLLKEIGRESGEVFEKYPSQIICLINEIDFNSQCNEAIERSSLKGLNDKLKQKLSELTKKCHEIKNQLILSKIKSLILDLIHQISIVEMLQTSNIKSVNDWNWYKQLKFRQDSLSVAINMSDAEFEYTFEYQGNAQKLVYTPLTDKCYLTLTQAMKMGLGGNPYGPAGTGKTQSVKALALAFGRQVLVFNCDEGLDFHSMGRIFMGLVKCGAWGCFDEFNRLLEEQLSAISQQIQIIQQAIKAQEKVISLLGKQVDVNFNSGIFVTLNPAGKGYGGRSKLPDNLKQLFRPVAMSVPDNELIAEVLLFAEGFKTAKELAQKIITIFRLSSQLLSRQLHYDWGLRALKTILTVAGRLIFQEKENVDSKVQSQILIKALRINTISKLTFNDMLKFNVLVEDVFPGINIKDIIYEEVSKAIRKVFEDEKFDVQANQLNKILQFYEATKQRIGTVLVGPSGCGKTTIWKTLKKAYEHLNVTVKTYLINPKSMPRSSFLGHMNNDTRQFSEGVLTNSARLVIKEEQQVLSWIICDGDVDPEWIEALNSVLDDNHLLTLPTGQRISFGSNVNFIFETDNLQFASPATISRMGMIFMNEEDININSIITKWSKSLQQEFIKKQVNLIEQICNKIYEIQDKQIVSTTKVGLVRNALSLISRSQNEQEFKLNLVKGLASNFPNEQRGLIFEQVFGKSVPGNRDPLSLRINNGKISEYKDDPIEGVQKIYMTKSIKKDIYLVSNWLQNNQSVIIVGKEGCGKSLLLEASIAQLEKQEKCKMITIHCNRQTKAELLIQKLFQTCHKVTSVSGRALKPQGCKKQIFVLKEVNLPKPDKYNTIELITFLQSLITHEGFYDHNLEFVKISQGIQFVCLMKPSSTIGRFDLTTRFVSNLRVIGVDYDSVGTKQKLGLLTPHSETIDSKLQEFWHLISDKFKPDDHPHYLFSPRNLNAIVDHLKNYDINFQKEKEILSAAYYEVLKQFGDKLVNIESKQQFKKLVQPLFGNQSNVYYYVEENKLKICSKDSYVKMLKEAIKNYETDVKEVDIILIDQVIDLMSSIEKKIVDQGSLLLAGSSGSLRKTAARIIAHKHKITLLTLSNIRNPSLKEFYKDLKSILEVVGGQNKKVMLFMEEQQLGKNIFYEKINSLISSGQISGLFNPDQIQSITQDPEQLRSESYGKTLYESFIERIKRNLIVVLSFDHRNKEFYEICSSNPAFYSYCRIIWTNCYDKPSLRAIAEARLKELNLKDHEEIVKGLVTIHNGSSQKYIELVDNFITTYSKLQSKSGNKLSKLKGGLKKLLETSKVVDELTAEALKKKKQLTIKQKEVEDSLNEITDAMQTASASKAETEKLEEFLSVEEKKIQKDKRIVTMQLEKVQPLIQEAKTAVSGLSKKNIENIRAFMNPPQVVRHVLKAVLTIFGNKDESWNSMKNFLKVCKEKILYFEIRDMQESVRIEVEKIIEAHAYSFLKDNVWKASQEAVPLADWVKATVEYSKTYEKVRPLEQNLNRIEKELSKSRIRLNECKEKKQYCEKRVAELNNDFVKKKNEEEVLKSELTKAQNNATSGQELLEKLKDEKVRWERDSDKLQVDVEMLPKYTAMTAAFLTYVSSSPQNIRHQKTQQWKKAFNCHYYNFLTFVTTEANTLQEVSQGLPNDQLSVENSQILLFQKRIPLIIDPHTQASNWLKGKLLKEGTVEMLTQQNAKFINTLELSLRFGKTLILEEIDFIEPILTPIIKNDFQKQGPRNFVQIGEKMVDVNETFRFYLTTRNSSIDIPHHQIDLVSVINFSVTRSGLEGKLLSIIITEFQPQIEKQKQELLEEQEKLKINLSDLEEKLLKELADSSGNILQNKGLINSLNETKEQSQIVSKSLKDSETLQMKLDQKRQVYMPVSEVGAKLYISLSFLKKLNPMYKYNLSQFIQLFRESLAVGENSSHQINTIKHQLIKIVYDNISIGLLKSHRLLLGIIIIKEVLEDPIPEKEFDALVGNMAPEESKSIPSWIEEKQRQTFSNFVSVLGNPVNFNERKWADWVKVHDCENSVPESSMSSFQECLLINSCRPDRLTNSLSNFVQHTLELTNLSGIQINMKKLTEQKMSSKVPLLFIVSVGFDPSKQIQEHAIKTVGKEKFKQLSMGGDQNDYALELLKEAAESGKWLCLKNLHLVIGFVSILEKEVLSMEVHPEFRLFLTTQAHHKFPPILLETCYKVSYEAPPGLKKNFTRILNSQNINPSQTLEMILTYFHALIQQRRNYIPQGWTKSYEFNYGDYKSGLLLISEIVKNFDVNWNMLYGLMLDTIYGGRIDNAVDLRLLDTYVHEYFNKDVLSGKKSIYKKINSKNIGDIAEEIPDVDIPDLYGLPNGIDKAILRIQGKEALENLKIVSIGNIEDTKFSRETWKKSLSPILNLWKGLEKNLQQVQLKKIDGKKLKSVDPIESFVFNEANEALENYYLVKKHLESLERVLFGNDILTTDIEEIGKVLLKGEPFGKWRKIWEGPDLISEWLKIFVKKLINIQKWVQMTDRGKILSDQLDLSEVYRPEIFFNALKQKVGREKKIPVNQLKIKCSFGSQRDQISVKIKNLILQGCSLMGNTITDAKTDSQYEEISVLQIFYDKREKEAGQYEIPFYTDPNRGTLLSMLPVKVEGSMEKKIIASAAIMLKD